MILKSPEMSSRTFNSFILISCFILVSISSSLGQTNQCPLLTARLDCLPEGFPTLSGCESRRCVWCPPEDETLDAPKCVLPPNYGYTNNGPPEYGANGITVHLKRASNMTYYGGDAENLTLHFEFQSNYRLRVKLTDGTDRFEVPLEINPALGGNSNPLYEVVFTEEPVFSFKIIRKSSGVVVFDTGLGGLTFADQFIQISTRLPSSTLYGIGENEQFSLLHEFDKFRSWTLFTRDQPPDYNAPQYGVHPIYTLLEDDGNAHSVVFVNSNAQEFVLLPNPTPGLVYRTIGGLLDMYIFLGPTPEDTAVQYTEAIGRYPIPPYWSLGFHLCRIGYNTLENMKAAVERTAAYQIPQDVQYGDGDTKDRSMDFTVAWDRWADLPDFVREIKAKGVKYIINVDPFISTGDPPGTYYPMDLGNEMDVWVKKPDGVSPTRGKVWPPDPVYYADYTKNVTRQWWIEVTSNFHKTIAFDGLWIDMSEPSNLYRAEVGEYCEANKYNNPPYVPNIPGRSLTAQTVCLDHLDGAGRQYDTHSMYGYFQSEPTVAAVEAIRPGKRSFVLSRATFIGSGKYVAHWLGDNFSTWASMKLSIIGTIQFNLFGIPFAGADICGFIGNTTAELCQRWMQLGSFYPFSRNHNGGALQQDPGSFGPEVAESSRKALETRYTLLPYLYTLFYYHNSRGNTVARALWAEFPREKITHSIQTQFLWAEGLLISPVLDEGARSVDIYFPNARWFSYYSGAEIFARETVLNVAAPLDVINLHLRGGIVYPTQEPGLNTVISRENPMGLIVALDDEERAEGHLYYDDGDSKDPIGTGNFFLTKYIYENGSLTTIPENDGYSDMKTKRISSIRLLGAKPTFKSAIVTVNDGFSPQLVFPLTRLPSGEIRLENLNIRANAPFTIDFDMGNSVYDK